MELMQLRSEIDPVIEIYREKKPERVLEIGCWDGGTLKIWLENAAENAVVAAVDLEHRNAQAYREWVLPGVTLTTYTGNSLHDDTIQWIRDNGPYDWVFVDGGHHEHEVRSDVAVALPLIRPGGTIVLHDITPSDDGDFYGPRDVFAELEAEHRAERFQDLTPAPWSRGLGVVHL